MCGQRDTEGCLEDSTVILIPFNDGGSLFGVCDVTRSLRHGFLWHTTTNFELSHSAPNYDATVIKHKAISMIQCACFWLNYPACKSPLCAPRLSHHLWVCGLSFSAASFAVPSQTA